MTLEPTTTQTVQLSDQQSCALGYAEFGSQDGLPVLYLHGLPSSRFEGMLWHKTALKLGIRIIAPDRPGMGLSSRIKDRRLLDYPAQLAQLVTHLGLTSVRILGVSGGGPYALACAAKRDLFHDLQGVAVVAGLGPRDLTRSGTSIWQRLAYIGMDVVPGSLVGWMWDLAIGKSARNPDQKILRDKIKQSMVAQGGEEAKMAEDEMWVEGYTELIRGAFAQGSQGYVDDATLLTQPWGFDVGEAAGTPVAFWYGEKDGVAPASIGKALSSKIQGSVVKCYENDGHSSVTFKHQEEVLAWLKTQPSNHQS